MIELKLALNKDLIEVWKSQREAFKEDAKINPEFSPGNETIEEFYKKKSKFRIFKICLDKKIIGGICIRKYNDIFTWKLSRIFIYTKFQKMGLGSEIIHLLEKKLFFVKIWILETPENNLKNQKFYGKNGYLKIKKIKVSKNLTTLLYEKKK